MVSVEQCVIEMESNITLIQQCRKEIADLKMEKIQKRASAWDEAKDIKLAKQKEDFVKAKASEIQREIEYKESTIEFLYSKNNLLSYKMGYAEDE